MRRLALIVTAAAFAVAAVAGTQWTRTTDATAAQSAGVSMWGNRFWPAHITVAAGTTVTWVNEDYDSGEWHDVITSDGSIFSDIVGPGGTISFTFDWPGYYEYYCDLHEGMFGSVTVQ